MEENNLLARTRCYLGGNIEYSSDFTEWRADLSKFLNGLKCVALQPNMEMFAGMPCETEEFHSQLRELRNSGEYEIPSEFFKSVIERDLRMIDISDFCIFKLEIEKPTFGTIHELVVAVQQQKPIFISVGDKKKTPLWILGLVNHEYIYDSLEEIKKVVTKIDAGKIILNTKKWKLLHPELR